VTWAQEKAERAANVARALPERSRRLVSRVLSTDADEEARP
jgi:hypothetical protein